MTPTPHSRRTPSGPTDGIGLAAPPHSSEAERTVLGALLVDPNAVIPVADVLKPEDFYDPTHRLVFQAVFDLYQAHEPIDFITVSVRLAQNEKIQSLGGSAYLAELASSVPTSAHAVHYARIVRDKSMHRRLGDFARAVTGLSVDEKLSAEEALERAEQMLLAMSRDRADTRPSHVSEVASDSYDRYARLFTEGEESGLAGLQTGFKPLDSMLAGLPRGAFVVVAARPSMGKSSLALDIARHAAAVQKKTVCFFSLETTKEEIMDRTIAGVLGVEAWRLKKGEITQREFDALGPFFDELKKHPLYLDDDPDTSIANLRGKARRQKLEHGLDLLVIDYLQLIEVTDPAAGENRTQQVSHISRSLKNLARVLGCPVIALSQLSRAVEQRNPPIPILSDLRECVTGDTRLVDAATGRWVPITEVRAGDAVLAMDARQRIRPFAVEAVWATGVKPTYLLTTRTGRQIRATANHPLFTPVGWKQLAELRPGDVIATALRLPPHGTEIAERAELCRLLGYLTGDGTYQRHREVGFISADPLTLADVREIVTRCFPGVQARAKRCGGKAEQVGFSAVYANGYGKPHGNPLREWLRDVGVHDQRDREKHVPAWVFEAGTVGAAEFLAGYLATDGCVKTRRTGPHAGMWEIHFDTVSRALARDVQALLLRLGIVSTILAGTFSSKSTRPIYRVGVALSAENLRRCALLPLRGRKGALLRAMADSLPINRTNSGLFGLPVEVSALLAGRCRERVGVPYTEHWRDQGKRMRRELCQRWAERLRDDELGMWASSDLLWEPIRSIEPMGEAEVFDISVPGAANFLANGIVAHNSGGIEQDSDVVLMLYREDYYNEDCANPGITDVFVRKNRHGPTGRVSLFFDKAKMSFRDAPEARPQAPIAAPRRSATIVPHDRN